MGKTVISRTQIQKLLKEGKLAKWGSNPDDIFINLFQDCLDSNAMFTLPGIGNDENVQIIGFTSQGINKKESTDIFGTADNINNIHYTCKVILADSICSFYGIERSELIDIRQGKKLDGRKDINAEEVNKLFNDCLEKLNEKFNIQEDVQKHQVEVQQQVQVQPQQPAQQEPKPVVDDNQPTQDQAPQQPQAQLAPQSTQDQEQPKSVQEEKEPVESTSVIDAIPQTVEQEQDSTGSVENAAQENPKNPIVAGQIKVGFKYNDNDKALDMREEGEKGYGRLICRLEAQELPNVIIPYSDIKDKTPKTFKDIFAKKYDLYLKEEQEGSSFLEVITNKPYIDKASDKMIKYFGNEQEGQNGDVIMSPNGLQIPRFQAYRIKCTIITVVRALLNKNGITSKDYYTHGKKFEKDITIKNWIEENIVINGKKASVEDVVTKVVEILGIKNELDAEFAIKGSTNPAILVKALESDAELKDALKDNIKEIKNIVKEKGLEAGYGYISALHKKIEPLLTDEQKEIFTSLLKTKTLIEKKATIEQPKDTPTAIKEAGAKLLESKFRKMGLYKPADLINSPLNKSVKLICDAAASEGPQAAVIKYIPYLLKEANDENCLTQDQITALADICKKFDKKFDISQISNVDKETCDSIAMAIFEVGCKKLAKKAEKNAEKKGKNDSKKSEKDKKNAAKKFGKALKKAKLKKELIAKLEGTFKQNNEQRIIHDELNDFVKKEQIRKDNGNSSLTDEQFKALKEAVSTYIKATGGAETELLPDDTKKQVNEPAEKQNTPVQEQAQQGQSGAKNGAIAEPNVSSSSTDTKAQEAVSKPKQADKKGKTLQEQIEDISKKIAKILENNKSKEFSIEEISDLQQYSKQHLSCLQQKMKLLEEQKEEQKNKNPENIAFLDELIQREEKNIKTVTEFNLSLEITKKKKEKDAEIQGLKKQLEEAQKEAKDLDEKFQAGKKQAEELKKQVEEIPERRKKLEKEIEQFEEQLKEAQKQQNAFIQAQKVQAGKKQAEELKKQVEEIPERRKKLEKEIEQLEEARQQQNAFIQTQLQGQIREKQSELEQVDSCKDTYKLQLEIIEEDEAKAKAARERVEKLTKELAKVQGQNQVQQPGAADANAEAERLAKEKAEAEAKAKEEADKRAEAERKETERKAKEEAERKEAERKAAEAKAEAEKRAKVQELTKQLKEAQKQAKGTQNKEVERLTEELVKVQNGQQTTKLGMLADTVYKRELFDEAVKESKKEFYKNVMTKVVQIPEAEEHNEGNQPGEQLQDQNEPKVQQPGAADANAGAEERQSENDDSSDYQAKVEMATRKQALQNRYNITEAGLNLGALRQIETPKLVEKGEEISAPDNPTEKTAPKTQTTSNLGNGENATSNEQQQLNAIVKAVTETSQLSQDNTATLNQ